MEPARKLIVIMGPSGCGKSTIGKLLAETTNLPFVEGDDYHPHRNRRKMAAGRPLKDADREAWVDALTLECRTRSEPALVLACSALTPYVQSRLRAESNRRVTFVLLELPRTELMERLDKREGHFMPADLADSQLAALTAPADALSIDAAPEPVVIVDRLREALGDCREQQDDRESGQADDG